VRVVSQQTLGKLQTPVRLIGEDVVGVFGLARVARRPAPVKDRNFVLSDTELILSGANADSRVRVSRASHGSPLKP
jgi:hypothetical protein